MALTVVSRVQEKYITKLGRVVKLANTRGLRPRIRMDLGVQVPSRPLFYAPVG